MIDDLLFIFFEETFNSDSEFLRAGCDNSVEMVLYMRHSRFHIVFMRLRQIGKQSVYVHRIYIVGGRNEVWVGIEVTYQKEERCVYVSFFTYVFHERVAEAEFYSEARESKHKVRIRQNQLCHFSVFR